MRTAIIDSEANKERLLSGEIVFADKPGSLSHVSFFWTRKQELGEEISLGEHSRGRIVVNYRFAFANPD
jgi:hypothetical protein